MPKPTEKTKKRASKDLAKVALSHLDLDSDLSYLDLESDEVLQGLEVPSLLLRH